jgi:hypothetical protein
MNSLNSLGMLGGMFGYGEPSSSGTAWYGGPPKSRGGSLLMPWLLGDPRAAGILNQPADFWSGGGGVNPNGGNAGGGGGGGGNPPPPPPPPPQWQYPDLLQADYMTTNWFGK